MGGDLLVPAHAGEDTNAEQGDAIRDTRDSLYQELIARWSRSTARAT
jgi:hypothetical protein